MAVFFNAVTAVSLLLLLMATGYYMGHKGWMGTAEKIYLSKFVLYFAIPCTCFAGLANNLSLDMLMEFEVVVIAAIVAVISTAGVPAILAKFLHLPKNREGVFSAMAGYSNTLFIGLPVVTQIFGDQAIPYLMIYYLPNAVLFQTIGAATIRGAGEGSDSGGGLVDTLKNMVTQPSFLGIAAGLITILFRVELPTIVDKYITYMSNTVVPLALLYCGYILYELGLKNLKLMPGLGLMLVFRLLLAPVITWYICLAFGLPNMVCQIFALVAGLPVVSQATVFAGAFGADEEYAASGACLSTLLCCISVPVIMVIMS